MISHNKEMIYKVLKGLGNFKNEVVFVGGSVLELYINDSAIEEARITDDVDIVVGILTRSQYDEFEEELRKLDFKNDKDGPACRMLYDGIKVDIISTKDSPSGFTNKWYEKGFESKIIYNLEEDNIYIFPVEYFIASKFEAFIGRGNENYRTSHDIEDIIYVFNGNNEIEKEILSADSDVQTYIKDQIKSILQDDYEEIIRCHCIEPERCKRIIEIFQTVVL